MILLVEKVWTVRGKGWEFKVRSSALPRVRPDPWNVARALALPVVAFFVVMLLTACASTKVEYRPFEVKVPVAVPCAAPLPAEPDWATKKMPRVDPKTGEGLDVAVDRLVAERSQRIGYEEKLKAAVSGCQ